MRNIQYKKWTLTLSFLLAFALLVHSLIFLIINKTINPIEIMSEGVGQEYIRRISWRKIAETVFAVCSSLYCIGNIDMCWISIKKRETAALKKILLYFVTQVFITIVCTVPFGLLDMDFLSDYIFPVWGIMGTLCLILISSFLAYTFLKRRRT